MKTKFPVILLALPLLMAGCQQQQRTIASQARGYLEAVANYHFEEAAAYASRETREVTLGFFESVLPNLDTAFIASNTPAKITLGRVAITSDSTALVPYHKSTPIVEQDDTLTMVFEEGQWLARVVVAIPPMLNPNVERRTFTREEVLQMKQVDAPKAKK